MDLDINPYVDRSEGVAYLFSAEHNQFPSSYVELSLASNKRVFTLETAPQPFSALIGRALNRDQVKQLFPDIDFPETVHLKIRRTSPDVISVAWKTSIGTNGNGTLQRTRLPKHSTVPADTHFLTWDDFKTFASALNFRDYIFRGQSHPYPLQTTFHRSKRKVLPRYLNSDIQLLYRSVTGRVRHLFNLDRPDELGALLNLAQHHGFPTPLLDWTYSPFVAAWFAFQKSKIDRKGGDKVRIFSLNRKLFSQIPQFQSLTFSIPHVSILETLAIDNDRAIPQQGLLMLTNVQDIESHMRRLETQIGHNLLTAFDLPVEDADVALNDLAMMGITRSTLMPGLESICLDLRDRLFP
jgi:hypothetical protein